MNEEQLTEEELRVMVGDDELFNKYNLKNMYSVTESASYLKRCCDCKLPYYGNEALFYDWKYTVCVSCSKLRSVLTNKSNKSKKDIKRIT
jgi:capsid portal protein